MPIYENNEDRVKQSEAVEIIRQNMRHRIIEETPEIYRINHDFVISNQSGQKVGVGEVKCREYTADFFVKNPWIMDMPRINSLYNNCEKFKFKVMLVLYTKDKRVFWVPLRDVLDVIDTLEPAPAHMMKDDHGKLLRAREGVLIPFDMLTEAKERL